MKKLLKTCLLSWIIRNKHSRKYICKGIEFVEDETILSDNRRLTVYYLKFIEIFKILHQSKIKEKRKLCKIPTILIDMKRPEAH